MGNPQSKVESAQKDIKPDEGSLPSTPILTPKIKIIDNDPRSPSANIVRTPIQSVMDSNKKGTPIIGIIDSQTQDNFMVNIDPRSPTVEFTRTPVVVGNQPTKLRNKNLDHVKQLINYTSPKRPDSPVNNLIKGPKLIEVSTVIKKNDQSEKRKSYIGLLETDLDFVETDIDKVTEQNKQHNLEVGKSTNIEITSKILYETQEPNNIDEEEPKEKVSKIEHVTEIINEEPEMSVEKKEINKSICNNEEITSPIKETLEKISQMDKEIKDAIALAHNPIAEIDEEVESNEFDKKVTNLIYEDEEHINPPTPLKQKNENRTPLSERNINHIKKISHKLKVHDRPQKKDYIVSKIPVFKEKKGKSKIVLQCENTPPRQMSLDSKQKKTQWDADKTLII